MKRKKYKKRGDHTDHFVENDTRLHCKYDLARKYDYYSKLTSS